MITMAQTICKHIEDALDELDMKCAGCPQVNICAPHENCEGHDDGEARYCWPMIEAAILGKSEWKMAHRRKG